MPRGQRKFPKLTKKRGPGGGRAQPIKIMFVGPHAVVRLPSITSGLRKIGLPTIDRLVNMARGKKYNNPPIHKPKYGKT